MISEYQNEIIALIVILLLIVSYIIIRINKSEGNEPTQEYLDKSEDESAKLYDETSETKEEPLADAGESFETFSQESGALDGAQEGDFGVDEEHVEAPATLKRKSDIITRDVPKHGKITKQDFKEFAGIRILVAEDNLINQKVIAGLLADSGIELVMANDGQEALDILEKDDDFLMILMDAHMPRVDGFEATRIIRENPKYNHIVVVALSGDTAADDIKKMIDAGMEEQLEKPLRMDSLYDVLYAYNVPKKKENVTNEEYIEVPMTKELHGDRGLAICGGDEKFYFEILEEFVTTYSNSAHQLRELLTNSQEDSADKLLLDIVGVSANIGAEKFTKVANNLKDALKDTEEKSYFIYLDEYQRHLEVLVKDIKDFMNR